MTGKNWFVRFVAPGGESYTCAGLAKSEAERWFCFFTEHGWTVSYGKEFRND